MSTVTTVDKVLQAQLKIEMEALANRLDPSNAVLDRITRAVGGGVKNVGRMEFKWRDRRLATISDVVTADAAAAATTIAVANASSYHRDQQIFYAGADDMCYVDEDIGGTANAGQVKVRGKSGTGGLTTALSAGDVLIIGPESHAEGEAIPPAFANVETESAAYVFQFDETIKLSDILMNEEGYGIPEIQAQRKDKMIEQLKRYSLAMYLSIGGREILSAGVRRHSMTGLNEYLAGYTDDMSGVSGGLTLTTLGNLVRPTTIWGETSAQKAIMVGQNAQAAISAMPATALRATPGSSKDWGVEVNKLHTAFGQLPLAYDPILSQENGLAGEMYVLSTKNIQQVQLKGLPAVFRTNIGNSTDIHNQTDAYTGTRGLRLTLPEQHRRITNIG